LEPVSIIFIPFTKIVMASEHANYCQKHLLSVWIEEIDNWQDLWKRVLQIALKSIRIIDMCFGSVKVL